MPKLLAGLPRLAGRERLRALCARVVLLGRRGGVSALLGRHVRARARAHGLLNVPRRVRLGGPGGGRGRDAGRGRDELRALCAWHVRYPLLGALAAWPVRDGHGNGRGGGGVDLLACDHDRDVDYEPLLLDDLRPLPCVHHDGDRVLGQLRFEELQCECWRNTDLVFFRHLGFGIVYGELRT
ncbi:hypothetical protein PG997_013656 [Apiospora hydei]|uniref:Uncharacterized protein n=1 Tax=Apiospora hydei TaxID=1337664 RepID=A0ABR1V6U2_9PEZI